MTMRRAAREQYPARPGGTWLHRCLSPVADRHRLLRHARAHRELTQGFLPRRIGSRFSGFGADALRHAVQRQHVVRVHRQDVPYRLRLADECAFHDGDHRRVPRVRPEAASLGQAGEFHHAGGFSGAPFQPSPVHGAGIDHDGCGYRQLSTRPTHGDGAAAAGHDHVRPADGIRRRGDSARGDHACLRDARRLPRGGVDRHDPRRHPYGGVCDSAVRRAGPLWRAGQKLRDTEGSKAGKGRRAGYADDPPMVQLHRRGGHRRRALPAGDPAHLRGA